MPTTHQKGKGEAWGSLSHSSREHREPDGRNVEKQGGPWVRAEGWAGVPASGQPCPPQFCSPLKGPSGDAGDSAMMPEVAASGATT